MIKELRSLYHYRYFIFSGVKRDFQLRYNRSVLGILWIFIQPLTIILMYTMVFSHLMKAKIPGNSSPLGYSIFLCSGLLTWNFFVEILSRGQGIFLEHANLIKKSAVPKICLPVAASLTSFVNLLIVFSLFLIFLAVTGNFPGFNLIFFIPVVLVQLLFSFSLGLILGVVNVFFRDIGQMMGLIIQLWFWGTPIVYAEDILPAWVKPLVNLNPMTFFVKTYQTIMLNNGNIAWRELAWQIILSLMITIVAFKVLKRQEHEMADEL